MGGLANDLNKLVVFYQAPGAVDGKSQKQFFPAVVLGNGQAAFELDFERV